MHRTSARLPLVAFGLSMMLGMTAVAAVHRANQIRMESALRSDAQQIAARISSRVREHVALLKSVEALFSLRGGPVSQQDFQRFLGVLDLQTMFPGIQGIGFARFVSARDTNPAEAEIAENYGVMREVFPQTDQPNRTPITLLEPMTDRNAQALGYDMFSEPIRRAAMQAAISSDAPTASGPVELVQEITSDKQTGFLVYVPFHDTQDRTAGVTGFVYAPFRAGNLIAATLDGLNIRPLEMRVTDRDAPTPVIYETAGFTAAGNASRRPDVVVPITLEGRIWDLTLRMPAQSDLHHATLAEILMIAFSILFATATALAVRAKQREATLAYQSLERIRHESEQRKMLLGEMKHRIKNYIARIQSIARQSARSATDLDSFSATFGARLQAMADVQDLLTSERAPSGALRRIISNELRQCLNPDEIESRLTGPEIRLGESQSHSLALLVHELVTNAMKYGGLSGDEPQLWIRWEIATTAQGDHLHLTWVEKTRDFETTDGSRTGFGTWLMDVVVRGELKGALSRRFENGMFIADLDFPLRAVDPDDGSDHIDDLPQID